MNFAFIFVPLTFLTLVRIVRAEEESSSADDSIARIGDVIASAVVNSNSINVKEQGEVEDEPYLPPTFKQADPYLNTYQMNYRPLSYKNQAFPGLDIIGSGATQQQQRPTLGSLAEFGGDSVTTPEELLDLCCQYPACYDPLYTLCIDTCRKCEAVYPVTSWLPCPPLLNIPDCTSPTLSAAGSLPLACYPDIGPFGNIIPLQSILSASRGFTAGRDGHSSSSGQSYRQAIRDSNRKECDERGICRSSSGDNRGPWG